MDRSGSLSSTAAAAIGGVGSTPERPLGRDPAVAALRDSHPQATRVAEQIRALGHPVRLRIVALLAGGEEYVGRIAERLELRQAVVSQQLRVLRMQGLVAATWDRGCAYYRLTEPCLQDVLSCVCGMGARG